MAHSRCYRLAYPAWPAEDRRLWEAALEIADQFGAKNDPFAEARPVLDLPRAKGSQLRSTYSAFLGFLATEHPERLDLPPAARVGEEAAIEYAIHRLKTYRGTTVKAMLDDLRVVLTALSPKTDWTWLGPIANAARPIGKPKPKRYVTGNVLYALGIQLMDDAEAEANAAGAVSVRLAKMHRDGLLIAFLASVPLRRGTCAKLRIGEQLIRSGDHWELDIPASDTKTRVALAYSISPSLSERIDIHLLKYRSQFKGAHAHESPWASQQGRAMNGSVLYEAIERRTSAAFGFSVSPHRFRDAAATFLSERDPANVRAAKDLLGHASFDMTEKHYIMAQSRMAGRALAQAIACLH